MLSELKIAVPTSRFKQPLKRAIRLGAELGARGLVFDARNELRAADLSQTGLRQFQSLLRESRVEIASLMYPARRTLYDAVELDARVAGIKQACQFAFSLGAPTVIVRSGPLPRDRESEEWRILIDVLNDLARHSNHVGGRVALVTAGDDSESITAMLNQVTDGPIGLHFDPAAMVMSGRDAGASYRSLYERVISIGARDGLRDIDGSGIETELGRGDVDWVEFVALIEEASYRDWLVVDRSAGDDIVGDLARAISYLRRVGMTG